MFLVINKYPWRNAPLITGALLFSYKVIVVSSGVLRVSPSCLLVVCSWYGLTDHPWSPMHPSFCRVTRWSVYVVLSDHTGYVTAVKNTVLSLVLGIISISRPSPHTIKAASY